MTIESGANAVPKTVLASLIVYFRDGIRVIASPIQTISAAADREMPLRLCVWTVVAVEIMMAVMRVVGSIPLMVLSPAPFSFAPGFLLVGVVFNLLAAGVLVGVSYRLAVALGGSGSFERYVSAALVPYTFWVIANLCYELVSSLAHRPVGYPTSAGTSWLLYVIVAATLVYCVVAIRFAAALDYAKAGVAVIGGFIAAGIAISTLSFLLVWMFFQATGLR